MGTSGHRRFRARRTPLVLPAGDFRTWDSACAVNTIEGMEIRIDTGKKVHGGDELAQRLAGEFATALARFAGEIDVLQVHVGGETNPGARHRRCVLEARPAGHAPVFVTHHAESVLEACQGAVRKLESVLESTYGRARHRKGGDTIRRPRANR